MLTFLYCSQSYVDSFQSFTIKCDYCFSFFVDALYQVEEVPFYS